MASTGSCSQLDAAQQLCRLRCLGSRQAHALLSSTGWMHVPPAQPTTAKPSFLQVACLQALTRCWGCRKEGAVEIADYVKVCKENRELEKRVAELARKNNIATINLGGTSRESSRLLGSAG